MSHDEILKIVQIIAVGFVGFAAVCVSILQYKTNNIKLKLAMYDRRKNILMLTQKYMDDFQNAQSFELHIPLKFRADTADARYLFKPALHGMLTEIFEHGLKLHVVIHNIHMKNTGKDYEGEPINEKLELQVKMNSDFAKITNLFSSYLDLSNG